MSDRPPTDPKPPFEPTAWLDGGLPTPESVAALASELFWQRPEAAGGGEAPRDKMQPAREPGLEGGRGHAAEPGGPGRTAPGLDPDQLMCLLPGLDPGSPDALDPFAGLISQTAAEAARYSMQPADGTLPQDGAADPTAPAYYFLRQPGAAPARERPRELDVTGVRRDFPALHQRVHGKPLIWLDNAATTQKPRAVIDALSRYYERDNSNIHRGAHTLAARATDAVEGARSKVQRFLGASSTREIIFVRGATEGINLVAQAWGRKYVGPGDEIVVTTLEHHSNIVPWQMLAQEKDARLRVVPINDRGEVLLEEYERLLGPRTRIVSFAHVSNALGTVLPVATMTQMAHRHGARVLVDGAQAAPHFPVDVQAIGCDFYAFSGHKLFAPTGIGVLYGREEVLRETPPWQGGGNMIESVTFDRTTYADLPAKFEAGTGIIAGAVGLGAAIDYLDRIGFAAAAQYEHGLLAYGTEVLTAIPGLRLIGTAPEKAGVLSFVLDGIRSEDMGPYLDREGIAVRSGHHCAQPALRHFGLGATVRASLAFYNTRPELDALAQAVRKALAERR